VNAPDTARGLLRSSTAATLAQAWRFALMLGTNLALRRLIGRDQWGVWDWAETIFIFLAAARDLGLPTHVMRLSPPPWGQLLAVELGWGLVLAVAASLAAPGLALAFHSPLPEVVPVLRALTLFLVCDGLAAVALAYFERALAIERTLVPEAMRSLTYCGTVIALALRGHGVWSIVWAQVAGSAVFAALLWLRAGRELPLTWERGRTLALVGEALPLAAVWLLMYAVTNAARVILGARFEAERLAEYGLAYSYVFLASRVMQPPVGRALYPAFVALRAEPRRKLEAFHLGTVFLIGLAAPLAYFLLANAELVTRLLGGRQWVEAPIFFRALAFVPVVDPLGLFGGELLIALGRERLRVASLLLNLAALVGAGLLFTGLFGPIGMAWASYLPIGSLLIAWALYRLDATGFKRLLATLAELLVVPAPFFAAAWWLGGDSAWRRFVLSIVAGLAAVAWAVYRHREAFRAFFGRAADRADGPIAPGA